MHHVVPHEPLPAETGEVGYAHGPMSQRQPDVPEGHLSSFAIDDPAVFPGTHRSVWVHVPAGLDTYQPQARTIFLVVGPYPQDVNGVDVREDFMNEAALDVDPARAAARQAPASFS